MLMLLYYCSPQAWVSNGGEVTEYSSTVASAYMTCGRVQIYTMSACVEHDDDATVVLYELNCILQWVPFPIVVYSSVHTVVQ